MSQLQPVRGTRDLIGEDCRKLRHVIQIAHKMASRYGFEDIETPIFESSSVFNRTLGDASDIVTKQMYTFLDRGGDELTLRPEGTAGVARAFISEGLAQQLPLKLFYSGPMFRYERPQKGRYRQFYQMGVELLGVEKPQADLEVIALGWRILKALKVDDRVQLELNTLGDEASQHAYKETLVRYFKTRESELSADSKVRLEKNPLRILDSKDESDKRVVADAPNSADSLTAESKDFFGQLCQGLEALQIPFIINPRLVRGLDYYAHTVFEFTTESLGSQNAVLSGGRYDGLIKMMGGPKTPGVGWGAGIDRLALMLNDLPPQASPITVIPAEDHLEIEALKMAEWLRSQKWRVDVGFSGNMAKRLKRAEKLNSGFAVILGQEFTEKMIPVKDLQNREQINLSADRFAEIFKEAAGDSEKLRTLLAASK